MALLDGTIVLPLISIIVPTRNRRDVLGRLFASIASQDREDIEVIVVDDCSENPVNIESLDSIPEPMSERMSLIRRNVSVGACAARNAGYAKASGKFIFFVDDDVELMGKDLCSQLIAFAETNPRIGAIALAEIAPDGGWGFNLGPRGIPLEVARFFGCGVFFRRACLEEVGGFFEPLGYYYEEFELSMRVINSNWHIVFHPEMQIKHHRDARGRDPRLIARLISRNAFLTAVARFPLWMLPAALATQMGRFAVKSWARRPRDPFGPFVAAAGALRKLPATLNGRKVLRSMALRRYKRLAICPAPWKTF